MKKNLYLETTGDKDITTINNNLRFTENIVELVSQKIENKFLFFKGEWFLNYELGLPYFEEEGESKNILGKNPNLNYLNSLSLAEINSIEEIEKVNEFILDLDNSTRTLTINFSVQAFDTTIEGEIIL